MKDKANADTLRIPSGVRLTEKIVRIHYDTNNREIFRELVGFTVFPYEQDKDKEYKFEWEKEP